ncbi:MAG TPA: LysR substrate-binding domain-containing protein, partial [Saprospiraceae bacterium]|nr:LysR substrate-binding domain-containing protein [Saprospiraceae bacterium]
FLVLCETLHFGQAAESLHIVQPALTKQIKELEVALGSKLFDRNKRNVALTHEGVYFKERCKELMTILDQSKKEVNWISEGEKGEIKIGYVGSCIHTFLPQLLDKIASTFPKIHWYLSELTSIIQEREIKDGNLDLAFVRNPELDAACEYHIIFTEPFAFVLPGAHPITAQNFDGVYQFANEKFILPSKADGKAYYELPLSICYDAGFCPNIVHESVHGHTVMKLVEHNFGITLLPLSFQQFSNENVKFIPLDYILQRSEITMMWKKSNKNPSLAKVLSLIV